MASTLKKLHCDYCRLSSSFNREEFNFKDFLLDVGGKKQKRYYFSFGHKISTRKEHAHLFLNFEEEEPRLRLEYSTGKSETDDTRQPYFEDAAPWIGSFFKGDEPLVADLMAVYEYDKSYESLVQLDYPLLISSDYYEGAKITGHDIIFPTSSMIDRATIAAIAGGGIRIFLYTHAVIRLERLDIYRTIEKLGTFANALVIKD